MRAGYELLQGETMTHLISSFSAMSASVGCFSSLVLLQYGANDMCLDG